MINSTFQLGELNFLCIVEAGEWLIMVLNSSIALLSAVSIGGVNVMCRGNGIKRSCRLCSVGIWHRRNVDNGRNRRPGTRQAIIRSQAGVNGARAARGGERAAGGDVVPRRYLNNVGANGTASFVVLPGVMADERRNRRPEIII